MKNLAQFEMAVSSLGGLGKVDRDEVADTIVAELGELGYEVSWMVHRDCTEAVAAAVAAERVRIIQLIGVVEREVQKEYSGDPDKARPYYDMAHRIIAIIEADARSRAGSGNGDGEE